MSELQPERDIALQLHAKGVGVFAGTGSDTIKLGLPRGVDEPGLSGVVLYVAARGGPPPVPYMPASQGSIFTTNIEVVVRADADSQEAGITKARDVRRALHTRAPTDTALAGYISLTAQTSEPLSWGANEAGQWEWKIVFSLQWLA